jgi:3-dehydroquinate dehydratase/shikimate dehydrogenase
MFALLRSSVFVCRGKYEGPEPERLATLKLAALKGAPYVDVEFKASALFFAGGC